MDVLTSQAVDMLMDNEKIKKKVYPVVLCNIIFNVLIIALLIFIALKINYTNAPPVHTHH
jgi:high-affinity K+ transport system ATPase subunit B